MNDKKKLTNNAGAPVADNQNVMTAGKKGPMLLQDVWFLEKLAHFDREKKAKRRREVFPDDCKKAFEMGSRFSSSQAVEHGNEKIK
jgi:catalase